MPVWGALLGTRPVCTVPRGGGVVVVVAVLVVVVVAMQVARGGEGALMFDAREVPRTK